MSFTLKKGSYLIDQSKYSSQNSKGYNSNSIVSGATNMFTVDKEFLTKLESSLKKLAKSNEKIKQIMKEKEGFEAQCLKLRNKVKLLKEEKAGWQNEIDQLIQANHKMECRLKQAQVILNIEPEAHAQHQNNNTTTVYDVSHNSSQKTLVKHFG